MLWDSLPSVFYFRYGVTSWLNSKGQRLGDLAANTVVVHNPRLVEPDLDQVMPGKFKRRLATGGW